MKIIDIACLQNKLSRYIKGAQYNCCCGSFSKSIHLILTTLYLSCQNFNDKPCFFLGGGYKLQIFSYKILMIHLKNMHDYLTETIQIFIRCNQQQISKCFTFIILLLCLSSHNYNCMWTLNDCVKLCCVMLVWSQSRDGIRIQWFSTLLTYYW